MKKILLALTAAAMCFAACSRDEVFAPEDNIKEPTTDSRASNDSFDVDGIYYKIVAGNTVAVCAGETLYTGDVDIPSTVTYSGTTYNVALIDSNAFKDCSDLTSVNIPESVISIGDAVFSGCSGLTSINIPESVILIGSRVFENCSSLTSINIPNGVISIGNSAFKGCFGLTSITIPKSITSIGTYTFWGCKGLTSINIPDGVTSIKSGAFWDCSGLTSINIPAGVTSIEDYTFYGCSGLTSINIPAGVTSIRSTAFGKCSSLISINIPNGVTSIENSAFSGCSSLTSINIPDGVTSIAHGTFDNCSGLTSITIPTGVTSIGNYAFSDCKGLTSINIPDGVTSIGEFAFLGCIGLTSINIPAGVTSIAHGTFDNCSGLTSITIPAGVTSIGNYAFSGCSNLASIECKNTTPPTVESDTFENINKSALVYVPSLALSAYKAADLWKDMNIQPIVDLDYIETLALEDGTAYDNTVDRYVNTMTYTRTFDNTNWQPLFVPFSMSYKEWSDKVEVAELAGVHMYGDGRPTIIEFITVKSGKLWPNTPYVIKAKNTGEVTFNLEGCTLYGTPAEGTAFVTCSTPRWTYKFIGNYQTVTKEKLNSEKAYIMSGGKFSQSSADLNPERFYMLKLQSENGYWSRSAEDEEICIMVDGKLISE